MIMEEGGDGGGGGSWFPSFPIVFLETRGFQDWFVYDSKLYIMDGSIFDRETN